MLRVVAGTLIAAVTWLGARPAAASDAPPPNGPASEVCARRHPTALGQIACELARALPPAQGPRLVATITLQSGSGAPALDELATRLATLVAGELGPTSRALPGIVPQARARSLAGSDAEVVLLRGTLERDRFSVSADLVAGKFRFWDRFRKTEPGVRAHAFAARPLDTEIRSYLPRVPLVVSKVHETSPLDEPVVALACGDVNADGSPELALVGRRRVRVGRIVRGSFVAEREVPWSELSPLAASPLREPIATVEVGSAGGLTVGITDRADALELDADLRVRRRFPDRLPWGPGTCARVSGIGLVGPRVDCTAARLPDPEPEVLDAVASARLVERDGRVLEVTAARRSRDARLELALGDQRVAIDDPVGAQLALGDLDGDGLAELVSTAPDLDPALDFVLVRSLSREGRVEEAARIPAPSGVRALAVCPPKGGLSPIVAATGAGLWVLQ
ncbi:MAG: FG-GAP repeat protein [Pseudomonadota bacterium]|nr:MAG: hypothetical protein DIU78_13380 [Pseudomonadota bacterium]